MNLKRDLATGLFLEQCRRMVLQISELGLKEDTIDSSLHFPEACIFAWLAEV